VQKELFIHIGFPKCASTFMQKAFFPAIKDVEYIGKFPPDRDLYRGINSEGSVDNNLKITTEWLKAIYTRLPKDFNALETRVALCDVIQKIEKRKIVCSNEGLTGFLMHDPAMASVIAERIKAVAPESRIIIVLRNQISLISSLYRMYVATGGCCALKTLLKPQEEISGHSHDTIFMSHLKYDVLIKYYYDLFGKDNVLVIFFEDLVSEQKKCLSEVLCFMGSDDRSSCENLMKHHVGATLNFGITLKRLTNSFMKTRRYPDHLLPYFPLGILSMCRKLPSCSFEKYFGKSLLREIIDYYKQSNKRLFEILEKVPDAKMRQSYFIDSECSLYDVH